MNSNLRDIESDNYKVTLQLNSQVECLGLKDH